MRKAVVQRFITSQSWSGYWTPKLYDVCDGTTIDTSKWTVTNPNPGTAEFEQLNSINLYTLAGGGATVYTNNIKSTDVRAEGCWIFSYLDIPVGGYPTSYRRAGLINAAHTAGVELLREATDKTVLTFRIFTASTERYKILTTVKDIGIYKITIDSSHNINLYALINDIWVQQGVEQTWDVGSVSMFMSTQGAANTAGYTKSSLRDMFIRNADDLDVLPYFNHNRTIGLIPNGTTDNVSIINAALLTGDVYLVNGVYAISESIKIPSNRTVYGKNAKVFMTDNSNDNVFRNKDFDASNTGVKIIGQGNFCIDQNVANNDTDYTTHGDIGWTPSPGVDVYMYWTIPMVNVDDWEISGINIIDYSHWCIVPQRATNGVVKDIFFNFITATHNQDGIPILVGSNNISISQIKGKNGDDFGFVSSCQRPGMLYYLTDYEIGDTHDITYDDIDLYNIYYLHRYAGESADGNKLYNISTNNVKLRLCGGVSQVGLSGYYVSAPTRDSIYDITMSNITLTAMNYVDAHDILEACKNIVITDFVNNSGKPDLKITVGKDIVGISVNGVVYPVPTVATATVEDVNKDKVVITFSEPLDETSIPATTDFALAGKTITNVGISGAVVTLTVSVAYAYGNVITVDYTKPASNYIMDQWGAILATFADQAVTNNIAETYPAVIDDGNTVAWFDMNNLVTMGVGNTVSSWGDRTGLGHHLLQTTDAQKPVWSANGLLFDGFNDYMKCNTFPLSQPVMIYAVIKQVTWTVAEVLWDGNGASNRCGLTQVTSTPRIASFSVWTQNINNDNLAVDTWGIVRAIYNGASSSLQVDGDAAGTGTNNASSPDGFTLGATYVFTANANIQVKAVIIRKVSDSAGDQTDIYNYLAAKFGLPTI